MANEAVVKRLDRIESGIEIGYAAIEQRLMQIEAALVRPDSAPSQEAQFLWQLVYGAVARFGLGLDNAEAVNGVRPRATVQIPLLEVPAHHRLAWSINAEKQIVTIDIQEQVAEAPNVVDAEMVEPEATGLVLEDTVVEAYDRIIDEDEALLDEMAQGVREE